MMLVHPAEAISLPFCVRWEGARTEKALKDAKEEYGCHCNLRPAHGGGSRH